MLYCKTVLHNLCMWANSRLFYTPAKKFPCSHRRNVWNCYDGIIWSMDGRGAF
jgi:hypothetical protein